MCALEQSPQQLIYNLYNLVALAELKGYAMMQFSWMILKQYEKGKIMCKYNYALNAHSCVLDMKNALSFVLATVCHICIVQSSSVKLDISGSENIK